jgi:hypothetical protein
MIRDQLRGRCAARPWRVALRFVRSAARCSGHPHSSPLAGLGAGAFYALRAPSQKEHTPSPLSRWRGIHALAVWTPAGFGYGRWLIDLGSAMKPPMESGSETSTRARLPEGGCLRLGTKNPLPGGKWVCATLSYPCRSGNCTSLAAVTTGPKFTGLANLPRPRDPFLRTHVSR